MAGIKLKRLFTACPGCVAHGRRVGVAGRLLGSVMVGATGAQVDGGGDQNDPGHPVRYMSIVYAIRERQIFTIANPVAS